MALSLEKRTNGEDADTPPGPQIEVGQPVTWTYSVTNTGNVDLSEVVATDDQGVTVNCPGVTLAPGEAMECSAGGTATEGQYHNVGTATGTFEGVDVSASDHSHYYGGFPRYWVYLPAMMR